MLVVYYASTLQQRSVQINQAMTGAWQGECKEEVALESPVLHLGVDIQALLAHYPVLFHYEMTYAV